MIVALAAYVLSQLRIPGMQQLRRWYGSPEDADAPAVRRAALDRLLRFVEGVAADALPGTTDPA